MSNKHLVPANEPCFFPPPPGVSSEAATEAYRAYLDVLSLEAHVLMLLSETICDDGIAARLKTMGAFERVMRFVAPLERTRGQTPTNMIDASGKLIELRRESLHAIACKQLMVEHSFLAIFSILFEDDECLGILTHTRRLHPLVHLKMKIDFARRDASGAYLEVLGAEAAAQMRTTAQA